MTDIDETMDHIEDLLYLYVSAVDSYEHSNTCNSLKYLQQRDTMYNRKNELLCYIREAIEASK